MFLIGANAVILEGVRVGAGAIVAAGAIANSRCASWSCELLVRLLK